MVHTTRHEPLQLLSVTRAQIGAVLAAGWRWLPGAMHRTGRAGARAPSAQTCEPRMLLVPAPGRDDRRPGNSWHLVAKARREHARAATWSATASGAAALHPWGQNGQRCQTKWLLLRAPDELSP